MACQRIFYYKSVSDGVFLLNLIFAARAFCAQLFVFATAQFTAEYFKILSKFL